MSSLSGRRWEGYPASSRSSPRAIPASPWAADVSTACALLLGSATLVVDDIIKRFFFPRLDARGEWLASRGTVLLISLVTYCMATGVSGILKTLLAGLALNAGFAVIVCTTLFCPSLCRRGSALWVLLATGAGLAAWFAAPQSWHVFPHPVFYTLIAAVAAFGIVALVDRRKIVAVR